jgi:DNA-binding NtrC family response regulator
MTPEPMTKRFLAPHVRVAVDGTIPLKRIAKQAVREMEGNLILKALRENRWNRRKAAENLKISYRTLLYQMREIGLPSKKSRGQASKVSDNGDDSPPATE